jgi:hypothetical protein
LKQFVGRKRNPSVHPGARPDTGRELQLPLGREGLLGLTQDFPDGLPVELGLPVAPALPENEVKRLYGAS